VENVLKTCGIIVETPEKHAVSRFTGTLYKSAVMEYNRFGVKEMIL